MVCMKAHILLCIASTPSLLLDHAYVLVHVLMEPMPIQTHSIPLCYIGQEHFFCMLAGISVSIKGIKRLSSITAGVLQRVKTLIACGAIWLGEILQLPHPASCLPWPKFWMGFKNTSGILKIPLGAASFTQKQRIHLKVPLTWLFQYRIPWRKILSNVLPIEKVP